jgi:hypothetical protein
MIWTSEVRGQRWRSHDGSYSIAKEPLSGGRTGYVVALHRDGSPFSDDHVGMRWTLAEAKQLAARDERERVAA